MNSSSNNHKHAARKQGAVLVSLVTVSDTRTQETDVNGQYLAEQILKNGHQVIDRSIVKDDVQGIEEILDSVIQSKAQIIIFNGGTGISRRDRTYDVISRRLEKHLPGFGEIFRLLSYEQVGASAMLSRATAGVCSNTVIISLPGSPKAVELAWEKLIVSEIQHLAWELTR